MARKKAADFETSLAELQTLVERLESGELSLEDSLGAFEQGIRLTRDCQASLAQAEQKVQQLMQDASIIRNQAKIRATITNAQHFISIQKEFGSFDAYIWQFTGGKTLHNHFNTISDIPPRSPQSDAMSKELQKRGFKFVGSTICYAFMQSAGMVNDHLNGCSRNPLKA